MASLVSNAGSRARAAPRCPPVAQVVNLCARFASPSVAQVVNLCARFASPPVAQVVNLCAFPVRSDPDFVKADRP